MGGPLLGPPIFNYEGSTNLQMVSKMKGLQRAKGACHRSGHVRGLQRNDTITVQQITMITTIQKKQAQNLCIDAAF